MPPDAPTNKPSNVLFVLWRSQGHLNASFGLARRLTAIGFSIIYLAPNDVRTAVERQGFNFCPSSIFDSIKLPMGIGRRPRDLALLLSKPTVLCRRVLDLRAASKALIASIPRIIGSIESILDQHRPAFLVFDPFTLYFYIPAARRKIPAVALSTKSLATRDVRVPPYTSMTVPNDSFVSRIIIDSEWKLQRVKYVAWTWYEKILFGCSPYDLAERFSRHCEFPLSREWATRPIFADLRFKSVSEWVLHAREFDFPRSDSKIGNAVFLGPCVDITRYEQKFDWSDVPPGRLLVCILTSVFHPGTRAEIYRLRFLRELLSCMKTLPSFSLILATGSQVAVDALRPVSANVRIYQSIPAIQVIAKAELVITQGGGNISKEAILLGKKLLTFPATADQPGFSARLAYHGLSLRYPLHKARASIIRELILRTLANDEMIKGIKRMRSIFDQYDGSDTQLLGALNQLRPIINHA